MLNGHIGVFLHKHCGYICVEKTVTIWLLIFKHLHWVGVLFEKSAVYFEGNHNEAKMGTINYLIFSVYE